MIQEYSKLLYIFCKPSFKSGDTKLQSISLILFSTTARKILHQQRCQLTSPWVKSAVDSLDVDENNNDAMTKNNENGEKNVDYDVSKIKQDAEKERKDCEEKQIGKSDNDEVDEDDVIDKEEGDAKDKKNVNDDEDKSKEDKNDNTWYAESLRAVVSKIFSILENGNFDEKVTDICKKRIDDKFDCDDEVDADDDNTLSCFHNEISIINDDCNEKDSNGVKNSSDDDDDDDDDSGLCETYFEKIVDKNRNNPPTQNPNQRQLHLPSQHRYSNVIIATTGPHHLRCLLFPECVRHGVEIPLCMHSYVDAHKFKKINTDVKHEVNHLNGNKTSRLNLLENNRNEKKIKCNNDADNRNNNQNGCNNLENQNFNRKVVIDDKITQMKSSIDKEINEMSLNTKALVPPTKSEVNLEEEKEYSNAVTSLILREIKGTEVERIKRDYKNHKEASLEGIQDDCIVKIRGLPWQSTMNEVALFFIGLNIDCIVIGSGSVAKKNGEAVVKLDTPGMRALALLRHKDFVGSRYIEVYRSNIKEYLSALAASGNKRAQDYMFDHYGTFNPIIIRMRGLPYACKACHVVSFFRKEPITCEIIDEEDGVLFIHQSEGKTSGDAFVLLANDEEAQKAMAKHKQMIGSRYIELFKSSPFELMQVLMKNLDPRIDPRSTGLQIHNLLNLKSNSKSSHMLTLLQKQLFSKPQTPHQTIHFPPQTINSFVNSNLTPNWTQQDNINKYIKKIKNTNSEVDKYSTVNCHRLHNNIQINNNYHNTFTTPNTHYEQYHTNKTTIYNNQDQQQRITTPQQIFKTKLPINTNHHVILTAPTTSKQHNLHDCTNQNHQQNKTTKTCIRLRNLSTDTTITEIIHFLEEYSHHIKKQGIHLVYDQNGNSTGEAVVEMVVEKYAREAVLERNGRMILVGSKRYPVEIEQCFMHANIEQAVHPPSQLPLQQLSDLKHHQDTQFQDEVSFNSASSHLTPIYLFPMYVFPFIHSPHYNNELVKNQNFKTLIAENFNTQLNCFPTTSSNHFGMTHQHPQQQKFQQQHFQPFSAVMPLNNFYSPTTALHMT